MMAMSMKISSIMTLKSDVSCSRTVGFAVESHRADLVSYFECDSRDFFSADVNAQILPAYLIERRCGTGVHCKVSDNLLPAGYILEW